MKRELMDLVLTRFSLGLDYLLDHGDVDLVRMLPELPYMRYEAIFLFVSRIKEERIVRETKAAYSSSTGSPIEIRSKGSGTWERFATAHKASQHYFDDATLAALGKDRKAMSTAIGSTCNENVFSPKWFTNKYDVRKPRDPPVERNGLLFRCNVHGSSSQECPFGRQGPEAFAPIIKGQRFCVLSLLQRRRAASSTLSVGAPRCRS